MWVPLDGLTLGVLYQLVLRCREPEAPRPPAQLAAPAVITGEELRTGRHSDEG